MTVLVDTPIWSLAFRRQRSQLNPEEAEIVKKLDDFLRAGAAAMPGVVRQELLSGMRDAGEFERLRVLLRKVEDVPVLVEDYEDAARIANTCRSAGIAGSPVDFLLCALARRRSWPVFTLDNDFDRYQKLAGIVVLNQPEG